MHLIWQPRVCLDIKNSLQPKIYTEMLTIRLAETSSLPAVVAIPDNLDDELKGLRQEIDSLAAAG